MKLKDLLLLARKIEPWLAGIYLAYFLGVYVPPSAARVINFVSYGVLIALILIAGCWRQMVFAMTRDIPLMLLHIMAVVSVVWSAAPDVTGDETKAFVRAAVFGLYLAVRFGLGGEMRLLAKIFGISVVLSLIAGAAIPSYGVEQSGEWVGSWKGIFAFKNSFAAQMAFAIVLFVMTGIKYPKWRWLIGGLGGLAVVLLLLSRGKTSLAALLITLYLLPLYGMVKQHYKVRVVIGALVMIVSLVLALLAFFNLQFIVVDVLGKNLEFNGRIPIWLMMLDKGFEHFWLGHGYAAFWTSGASYQVLTQTWANHAYEAGIRFNAHNGYLDLFLQLGMIGLLLYLASLATLFFKTFYLLTRLKSVEAFWVFETMILLSLTSFADSLSVGTGGGEWSLYVSFSTLR